VHYPTFALGSDDISSAVNASTQLPAVPNRIYMSPYQAFTTARAGSRLVFKFLEKANVLEL
jgi:hypothetical protein